MKTHYTFFLLGLMILTSCQQVSNSQDSQSQPSIITSDSTNHSSNDESSLAPSSEYIPPYDPAIPGLTHSSVWPSANLDAYLTYAKNINMPNFSALSGFHHGVYESLELGEFYRVVTRVNDQNELASYQNRLINDFDFKVEAVAELPGLY